MRNSTPKFLVWQLRSWSDKLGLAGIIGLGLLAFSAILLFTAVLPLGKEVQSLKNDEYLFKARHKPNLDQFAREPEGQLAAFYQSFPSEKGLPDLLEKLYQASAAQNVILERGEYNLLRYGSDRLVRYEVTLPVKGDYIHIRNFLSRLLADVPNISLDSVDLERRKISDSVIDARLKITYYLLEH